MLNPNLRKFNVIVFVIIFLLSGFPVRAEPLFEVLSQDAQNSCRVTVSVLNLRDGPGIQFKKIGQLQNSTVFTPTERSADSFWVFGSSSNLTGWTSARFLACASHISQLPVTKEVLPVPTAAVEQSIPSTPSENVSSIGDGTTTLLGPLDANLSGRQIFSWRTTTTLEPNQGFLLIFWKSGQDPLAQGFNLQGPITVNEIKVDFDKVTGKQLQSNTEYYWGIALVRLHPKPVKRIKLLSGGQKFMILSETANGIQPPPPAPPK